MFDKTALIDLCNERALKRGQFTLASGRQSHYYFDGKQVTLDSRGAVLVAHGILELLDDDFPDAVGGLAIGADPITAAVITLAGLQKKSLHGCLIRKEAKGHGTKKYVEGPVQPGSRVAVVEDVVTTGGSSLTAIERLEEFGCIVNRVVTIVDRLEGGREAFESRGYRFQSLLTIRDFGLEPLSGEG